MTRNQRYKVDQREEEESRGADDAAIPYILPLAGYKSVSSKHRIQRHSSFMLNRGFKAYMTESGSLQTFLREGIGSFSNQSLRYGSGVYGADIFDCIWLPYNSENWSHIRTNNSIDNDNEFKLPENVMAMASVPTDPDAHMNISLTGLRITSRFYVFLHFSEIQELDPNDTR
ncbi:hypothetical protein YC2023_042476 [Brassica napus]